jgi:hypothetical protein
MNVNKLTTNLTNQHEQEERKTTNDTNETNRERPNNGLFVIIRAIRGKKI